MRRAGVGRTYNRPARIPPSAGKVSEPALETVAVGNSSPDVLDDQRPCSNLANDTPDVGPEVALVVGAAALAGDGVWRAWEAGSDEIHATTVEVAREGREIVPDRRRIQPRVFHPRHENGRSVGVPLDVAHAAQLSAESSAGSELQSSDPGAYSQGMDHRRQQGRAASR